MKNKVFISTLLILAMIASVTACSSKETVKETAEETTAETTAKTTTEESEETTETEATESEETESGLFEFTQNNFPTLDGSTSTKPMAVAIASVLLGIDTEEADSLLTFHKTTDSFRYFCEGSADMLIVAQPSDEAIASLNDELGSDNYIMEPFASEALVFVVNKDNPIESLTTEQIQKIYTGEITNWKEVGGEDLEIVPIQRNHEAGSQVMMEKLVMKDIEMMEPPVDYIASTMNELTETVKSFDNSSNAIGYTVYYYAKNMKFADGLKIIKVDDVDPSPETIKNKDYPFINPYFLVIRSGLESDDPTQILYDWIMSDDGQKLVDKQGYVPVK